MERCRSAAVTQGSFLSGVLLKVTPVPSPSHRTRLRSVGFPTRPKSNSLPATEEKLAAALAVVVGIYFYQKRRFVECRCVMENLGQKFNLGRILGEFGVDDTWKFVRSWFHFRECLEHRGQLNIHEW
ncbi:hypothetical protein GWI33_002930 [Rhynchophorus ferrugineus]|uniref:Uncharacterized protein n=1 Tax=Rhynchophorus ferrugineus TaxID=354439 RepID=A0A834IK08_RHYFE|nr:hypothetical protein GWI33_002930 [Rhynchophorus ferrugineus]